MRSHRTGDRRGFALLVALAALVIIGGLIVGAFFASTQEFRIGRNTVLQSRAMTAAEYGLNETIIPDQVWKSAWANEAAGTLVLDNAAFDPGDGSVGQRSVVALGNGNFLVISEGFAGSTLGAQARKRLGGFVRIRAPKFNLRGAITTKGSIKIAGSTEIHGEDTAPSLWTDCPPITDTLPGVAYNPDFPPQINCDNKGCVTGDPPSVPDSVAANSGTYNVFGDITYTDLVAKATKTIDGGKTFTNLAPEFTLDSLTGVTLCDRKIESNWGDPTHTYPDTECRSYYPIIHVKGDLTLTGGAGQGILLVDGNLDASGGVNFYGPVIIKGALKITGNSAAPRFMGGVMAENVDINNNMMAGNSVVSYSSCAIEKAVNGSATAAFDKTRGWMEMY
jgi:Tfp pilus assembly protein PilX